MPVSKQRLTERPDAMTVFDIVDFPTPMDEIARHSPEFFDFVANLQRIEHNATALLDEPDTLHDYIIRDLAAALSLLAELRTAVEEKDGYKACERAYHLGMIDERMRTRILYDQRIEQGRKTSATMGKWREGKQQKTDAAHADIREQFLKRVAKRGKKTQPSITAIRQRIAEELDVSLSTVIRATKDLLKK